VEVLVLEVVAMLVLMEPLILAVAVAGQVTEVRLLLLLAVALAWLF
jgi:hypothetical protein